MSPLIIICTGLLLVLFLATKFLDGKSLNRIKARTVGHGQPGSARWATRREIKSYYTMVPYEPQKWRTQAEFRPTKPGFIRSCILDMSMRPDYLQRESFWYIRETSTICLDLRLQG